MELPDGNAKPVGVTDAHDRVTCKRAESFGPTVRILRSLIAAWYEFVGIVREVKLPDADVAR